MILSGVAVTYMQQQSLQRMMSTARPGALCLDVWRRRDEAQEQQGWVEGDVTRMTTVTPQREPQHQPSRSSPSARTLLSGGVMARRAAAWMDALRLLKINSNLSAAATRPI